MIDSNGKSYETPLESRNPPSSRPGIRYRAIWEALAVGILLGFADSNHAGNQEFVFPAYLVGGAILGLRHAGRASPCWLLLGVSLYAKHVVRIVYGRKPLHAEGNSRMAEPGFGVMFTPGLGV